MSRLDKVNQQIRREVGMIIQTELGDPRVQFVSITGVKVSGDLRSARVYFSVLGDDHAKDHALEGLNNARGHIRKLLASKTNMRNTPELSFQYDQTIEQSVKIDATLKEINDEHEDYSSNDQET